MGSTATEQGTTGHWTTATESTIGAQGREDPVVTEAVACRALMRALQITELTGPDSALQLVDLAEPEASHPMTPGEGVVVDVRAAGVAFPEVLQTRGEYQVKPPLPFVPGSEVAGVVRSASDGAPFAPGDRVAAFCMLGGFA